MIDIDYALKVLQVQMEVGFEVAHKRHSDLQEVRSEIETKLSFLFELNLLDKEEYFSMLEYIRKTYEEEKRKEDAA